MATAVLRRLREALKYAPAAAAAVLVAAASGDAGAASAVAHKHGGADAASGPTAAAATRIIGGAAPTINFRRVSPAGQFVAEFDAATRNPRWVIEHLDNNTIHGGADRSDMPFKEETALPTRFRARLSDYSGSGYDRGHMAPAANHRESSDGMQDTFYLSNIAPQVGVGLNRDWWARLEKLMRQWLERGLVKGGAKEFSDVRVDDVRIATGPAYLPTWVPPGADAKGRSRTTHGVPNEGAGHWEFAHHALGSSLRWVSVPTHFYKVVCVRASAKTSNAPPLYAVAAFLVPNAPIPADVPATAFVVPLALVEDVTGLAFFRDILGLAAPDGGGAYKNAYGPVELAEAHFDAAERAKRAAAPAPAKGSKSLHSSWAASLTGSPLLDNVTRVALGGNVNLLPPHARVLVPGATATVVPAVDVGDAFAAAFAPEPAPAPKKGKGGGGAVTPALPPALAAPDNRPVYHACIALGCELPSEASLGGGNNHK